MRRRKADECLGMSEKTRWTQIRRILKKKSKRGEIQVLRRSVWTL